VALPWISVFFLWLLTVHFSMMGFFYLGERIQPLCVILEHNKKHYEQPI
jgi:hypothetical protein